MSKFSDLINNELLFWSLFSCVFAQVLKIIFNLIIKKEFKFSVMFETGGMPSSHSALISSLTVGLGLELGFDSPIFALAVGISLIVMYDASGIRQSAGLQAIEINKISEKINDHKETYLKETLGHTKLEVFVGSCLGVFTTIIGMEFINPFNQIFIF